MPDFAPKTDEPSSTTRIIESFYQRLQDPHLDGWVDLWSEDGTYLNPFASGPYSRRRVSGIDQIAKVIGEMRESFDVLHVLGHKVEPALAPEVAPTVVYVSGDWRYSTPLTTQSQTSHFHHRLEIHEGEIVGWVDYTNPLTCSSFSRGDSAAYASPKASASRGGDGCPGRSADESDRLEVVPTSSQCLSNYDDPQS